MYRIESDPHERSAFSHRTACAHTEHRRPVNKYKLVKLSYDIFCRYDEALAAKYQQTLTFQQTCNYPDTLLYFSLLSFKAPFPPFSSLFCSLTLFSFFPLCYIELQSTSGGHTKCILVISICISSSFTHSFSLWVF